MIDTEKTLKDLLNRLYPGEEPKIQEMCVGVNYTSALYEVNVGTRSLFAKVANVNEEMRSLLNAGHMYATELCTYSRLAPAYAELQRTIPEEFQYRFPEYSGGDGTVGQETIVMEDLRARGYKTMDRLVSVTWEQASSAVTVLATFHSLSFALSRSQPELHKEFLSTLVTLPLGDTPDSRKISIQLTESGLEVVRNLEHKKKLKELFTKYKFESGFLNLRQPLGVPVICHGDYRPSNLLIKETENGVQTMVVDYQTVHAGCPASDLVRYVIMGTDQNFRLQYHDKLLKHYHKQLKLALARFDIQVEDVYPWETFQDEFKQLLPDALAVAVAMLPLDTVETEEAPSTAHDDLTQFAVPPNTRFQERFESLVQDYVTWGVL